MNPQPTPPLIPFTSSCGNAFLLPAPQGYLALDVGTEGIARRMVRYVEKLGHSAQSIQLATATHAHPDRIGGLHELQRLTHCEIQLHRQAKRVQPAQKPWVRSWLERVSPRVVLSRLGRPWQFQVQQWFENNTLLPGGWRVVYTPGHARESISLYHPRHEILLAGNTLVGMRGGMRVNPFNEDNEVLAMSLCTLEQLKINIVYPAHGRPSRGQQAFSKALRRRRAPTLQMRLRHLLPAA